MRLLWNANVDVDSFSGGGSAIAPFGTGVLVHNQSPEIQYTVTGILDGAILTPMRSASPNGPWFPYLDDNGDPVTFTSPQIYMFQSGDAYHGISLREVGSDTLVNVDLSYI